MIGLDPHAIKELKLLFEEMRPAVYGLLLLVTGGFIIFYMNSGKDCLEAAVLFFNAPVTRYSDMGMDQGLLRVCSGGQYSRSPALFFGACAGGVIPDICHLEHSCGFL